MSNQKNPEQSSAEQEIFSTKRKTVVAMENILEQQINVLDHGFIRLIDYMGDDSSVVQAARVSYGKGTKQVSNDKALINYLMSHRHTTPFEMCDIKLHVKLPIFVARQWVRHRTASLNEYSARYSILSNEFYLPKKEHICAQSLDNKQGRTPDNVSDNWAEEVRDILEEDSLRCYRNYDYLINPIAEGEENSDKVGISRELARINLTLNHYTEWYWKINLHNLLHFIRLRADNHAQYEIRQYAEVLSGIVQLWVPMVFDAFTEYMRDGAILSKTALQIIRRKLSGEEVTYENSGLYSKREWNDLNKILELQH